MSTANTVAELEKLWQGFGAAQHWGKEDASLIHVCQVDPIPEKDAKGRINVDGWKMSYETEIQKSWTNYFGNLHGGAASWMIDVCTTGGILPLITDTFWGYPMYSGVSISIDSSFLHPCPTGTKVRITVEILKMSAQLAQLRCEISDWNTGKVYVIGNHLKSHRGKLAAKL